MGMVVLGAGEAFVVAVVLPSKIPRQPLVKRHRQARRGGLVGERKTIEEVHAVEAEVGVGRLKIAGEDEAVAALAGILDDVVAEIERQARAGLDSRC